MRKGRKKLWALGIAALVMGNLASCAGVNPGKEKVDLEKKVIDGGLKHVSVHDPSITAVQGNDGKMEYYIFGTHITTAKSTDLANWEVFTNGYQTKENTLYGDLCKNLEEPFRWAGEDDSDCTGGYAVWAPDVVYNERYENEDGSKGAYLLYFCTSSTYCRSVIGYAVSDKIEGPYVVYDEETKYYYLYTTYNYLDSVSGYNMRLFRSKTPTGPFVDAAGNSAVFESKMTDQYKIGIKVMGNYMFNSVGVGYRSPGHCSALMDADGKRYLFYHTRFDSAGEMFEDRVHQQFMNEDGWPVTAVFENREDEISESGYSKEDICGEYEFINHGTASDDAEVKTPQSISLTGDGKITGDISGTWEEKDGSYLASFEIGEVVYKGVFFKQHNETRKRNLVMTFTAIGSNNETIWGVKELSKKDKE